MMDEVTKKKVLARLRKTTGQVKGVVRMIEEDRDYIEVLVQMSSVTGALGEAAKLVLRSHIETGVRAALASGKAAERKQKLDELIQLFSRYGSLGGK
jgi:CsoR family transcriptional regulator, copper-sensing transcriptional repressor